MKNYLKFLFVVAMAFSFSAAHAQKEIVVALGDTVTLTSTNEGTTYEWSSSTDGTGFYKILPAENERTFTFRAFGENFYRVRYKDPITDKNIFADTVKVTITPLSYKKKNFNVTAGQGYVEVNGKPGDGISIPQEKSDVYGGGDTLRVTKKLTSWSNKNAHAVYFIHTPQGAMNLKMNVTAKKNSTVALCMRIYDTDTPDSLIAKNYITFKGTGSEQIIPVITANFGKKGYNKYDLECLYGNTNITSINKWVFDLEKNTRAYSPTILMSPSLHIFGWRSTHPQAPSGDAYDWAYEEVMIPGGDSIVNARYIMSLGVLAGYMGIQTGEGGAHRTVLFSQWDSGDTDVDPNLPDHLRSTAVDTGEGVIAQRFGAEGTGVQSFRNGGAFWEYGKYVQFITHCRNELAKYEVEENGKVVTKSQRNMLVSAWWNAQDEKGWQYISTLRTANRNSFIDSWYSFVECFVNYNGQERSYGYFRNGYAKARSGSKKWFHMNKADFGHNNGGSAFGKRNDIWQDVDPNDKYAWVMVSGGFHNNLHVGKCEVPLRSNNTPVDTIDIKALLAREELAIAKEAARLELMANTEKYKYDNTKWELLSFSSEEPTGENKDGVHNGLAKLIIDGNNDTYWHSQWQSRTAPLPHSFVIDCKEAIDINAFYFTLSGGTGRYQKEILIEGSLDNETWYNVYENANCPCAASYALGLDSTAQARYLRLTIKETFTGEIYARINEFGAALCPVSTSIDDNIRPDKENLKIYTVGNNIYIDAPETIESAKVDVYSMSGNLVVTHTYDDIKENDLISIHSLKFTSGIYTVRLETNNGKIYTSKVLIK
ncbi:MAG: DUF3472 domain-containing protein [Bacteroidales bacterium]|nr:DUF3472 domain-containing protein [Bacteroidales bacterium]